MKKKRILQSLDKRKMGDGSATAIICGLMPFDILGDT